VDLDDDAGTEGRPLPSSSDLERAIASVPGVREASVDQSGPDGRGRLRIRLAAGEDAEAVSWSVAATLRERFGIMLDPRDIRVRDPLPGEPASTATAATPLAGADGPDAAALTVGGPDPDLELARLLAEPSGNGAAPTHPFDHALVDGPAQHAAAVPDVGDLPEVAEHVDVQVGRGQRAAIRHLDTARGPQEIAILATLEHGGRASQGRARTAPTSHGVLRAVAEATLDALRGLLTGHLLASVDRATVVAGDPAIATVVVTLVHDGREETLLGASVVRDDPQRAVMRATLDAVNRRVGTRLVAASLAADGGAVADRRAQLR
jgi:hypothetical protein